MTRNLSSISDYNLGEILREALTNYHSSLLTAVESSSNDAFLINRRLLQAIIERLREYLPDTWTNQLPKEILAKGPVAFHNEIA